METAILIKKHQKKKISTKKKEHDFMSHNGPQRVIFLFTVVSKEHLIRPNGLVTKMC